MAEFGEIEFDKLRKDADVCDAGMHTQCRRVHGPVNWLQSRAQYQDASGLRVTRLLPQDLRWGMSGTEQSC